MTKKKASAPPPRGEAQAAKVEPKSAGREAPSMERLVFSGHESFVCRYGWLPKLYEAIQAKPELFVDDQEAILFLGLGKNMVRSIRFWGEAFGLLEPGVDRGFQPTEFARRLLDPKDGRDPYLEDAGSLWRLHWMITTSAGLGGWRVAFLDVVDSEVARDRLVEMVQARAGNQRREVTTMTVTAHVDILLRAYDSARDTALAPDESLGCPLQELDLLDVAHTAGRTVVRFKRGPKPGLDVPAFAYALEDFWSATEHKAKTISARSLMLSHKAPATVFRLDEPSLYELLEQLSVASDGKLELQDDGVGGWDLVARRGDPHEVLSRIAWQ